VQRLDLLLVVINEYLKHLCLSETVAVRIWFKLLSFIFVLCLIPSNCSSYILFFSLDNCMPCERQVMRAFCFIFLSRN